MTLVLLGGLGLVAAWLLSDFVYSLVVARRIAAWEAAIERDEHGVQGGRAAYQIGDGAVALLFLHGIGDSPRVWRKMAPRLAERGFTCRAMRLPGFAEPLDAFERTTREQWVHAVTHEIEDLRQDHDRVGIVAHSLGAAVAIACLVDHPEAADAAVFLAPLVEVSGRRSPILPPRAWHEFAKRALFFTRVTETPFPIDAHDPAEREDPGRARFTPRRVFDEVFDLVDENRRRFGEFRVPLMTVLAEDDRVVDRRAARGFHDEASSSPKTLQVVTDAGHAMPVDRGWEALARQIADFVGSS